MADKRTEEPDKGAASSAPQKESRTHAGPTIDLDASQVTEQVTEQLTGETEAENAAPRSAPGGDARGPHAPRGTGLLLASLCGGAAALAVVCALWFGFDAFAPSPPPVTAAQFDGMTANVDALAARLAKAEAAATRPPPPADAALTRRMDAAESTLATMRGELAAMKAQLSATDKSFEELKADARAPAVSPDAARADQRLDRIERSMQTLQAETAKRESAAAQDIQDINARRLAVASALDMAVSRGEPFASELAAAKQLAASAQPLGALDDYAAKGVPGEAIYLRRIVTILERADRSATPAGAGAVATTTTPTTAAATTTTEKLLDRLQSGFARLVRIERSDAPAAPAAAVLPAVNASDDLSGVRRDVAKLPQAAQPEIRAWLKSVDERDAALAASRAFANDALAAVAKSGQ